MVYFRLYNSTVVSIQDLHICKRHFCHLWLFCCYLLSLQCIHFWLREGVLSTCYQYHIVSTHYCMIPPFVTASVECWEWQGFSLSVTQQTMFSLTGNCTPPPSNLAASTQWQRQSAKCCPLYRPPRGQCFGGRWHFIHPCTFSFQSTVEYTHIIPFCNSQCLRNRSFIDCHSALAQRTPISRLAKHKKLTLCRFVF